MELFERLDSWFFLFTVGLLAWTLITNPRHVAAFFRQAFNRQPSEAVSSVSSDTYDNPPAADAPHSAADGADGGLSGGLSALSGLQQHAVRLIMLDSSLEGAALEARTTAKVLVRALVAAGWKTSRIRQVVKGDNNTISEWITEARNELGLRDERVIGVGRDGREVRL
jgi:hypothetical protein